MSDNVQIILNLASLKLRALDQTALFVSFPAVSVHDQKTNATNERHICEETFEAFASVIEAVAGEDIAKELKNFWHDEIQDQLPHPDKIDDDAYSAEQESSDQDERKGL